jgi:predicted nucleic acid-binding protein
MNRYLLDTDVMSTSRAVTQVAASYVDSLVDPAISIITAQELIVGARDKRDLAGTDSLIGTYPVGHIDAAIGLLAYDLLKRYAKSDGLRTFDSLIGATAMARDLSLLTRNRKNFAMIDGLLVEAPQF